MWEVKISDGSVVQQNGDFSLWRQTMTRCKEQGLHIESFTWEGKEVDNRGVECFIINDIVGSAARGIVRARIGLGTFRSNGKGRIQWKTLKGDPTFGNYSEVVKAEDAARFHEIAVERKVNEETAQ